MPKDMTVCMHICRGNFKSAWVAEGGYEPVAEALFNELDIDGYFLEYDDARSGGFEPLRFVPKGKIIVLGLVTTKLPQARKQGRAEAAHRRGREVRALGPAGLGPAMRLLLDRRRQRGDDRRREAQARAHRRGRARGLGRGLILLSFARRLGPCVAPDVRSRERSALGCATRTPPSSRAWIASAARARPRNDGAQTHLSSRAAKRRSDPEVRPNPRTNRAKPGSRLRSKPVFCGAILP